MLRFLSSFFSSAAQDMGGLDEILINEAIECAVDGTDRRLRTIASYKKRLREPVIHVLHHVITLIDNLPAASEISVAAFSGDSRL